MPVSTVFPLGDEVPLPYKSMYDPFVTLGAVAAVTSKILGLPTTPEYIDILMKYEVDRMILNIPNDSAAAAPGNPKPKAPSMNNPATAKIAFICLSSLSLVSGNLGCVDSASINGVGPSCRLSSPTQVMFAQTQLEFLAPHRFQLS